jgi:hypothetical protein
MHVGADGLGRIRAVIDWRSGDKRSPSSGSGIWLSRRAGWRGPARSACGALGSRARALQWATYWLSFARSVCPSSSASAAERSFVSRSAASGELARVRAASIGALKVLDTMVRGGSPSAGGKTSPRHLIRRPPQPGALPSWTARSPGQPSDSAPRLLAPWPSPEPATAASCSCRAARFESVRGHPSPPPTWPLDVSGRNVGDAEVQPTLELLTHLGARKWPVVGPA